MQASTLQRMNSGERQVIKVENDVKEVARIVALADEFLDANALSEDFRADVTLALDEILSNVIRHGQAEERIQVEFAIDKGSVEFVIEDDGKAFNPLTAPMPKFDVPIEERKPGGMGIFLTKHMMSELAYRREGNRNVFTMRRALPTNGNGDTAAKP